MRLFNKEVVSQGTQYFHNSKRVAANLPPVRKFSRVGHGMYGNCQSQKVCLPLELQLHVNFVYHAVLLWGEKSVY